MILDSVLGTCLVSHGVGAVDENTSVNLDVAGMVSSENEVKVVEKSGDSVNENVKLADTNVKGESSEGTEGVAEGKDTQVVSSVEDNENDVKIPYDGEESIGKIQVGNNGNGGSLGKYLCAGIFGSLIGNASLLGMYRLFGEKK